MAQFFISDKTIRSTIWDASWEQYYYNGIDGGDFSLLKFIPVHAKYYHGLKTIEVDFKKF